MTRMRLVNDTNAHYWSTSQMQVLRVIYSQWSTSQMHIGQPHAGIECNIHSSLLSGCDLDPVGAELGVI